MTDVALTPPGITVDLDAGGNVVSITRSPLGVALTPEATTVAVAQETASFDTGLTPVTSEPQMLKINIDEVPGTPLITYVGDAVPGTADSASVWRIKRITETTTAGSDAVIEWADGDANFDNVWDDRAILSYS